MKKTWIKPLVLALVFFFALITFNIVLNKENNDLTTSMAEATLPVMRFYYNETPINELHGYVNEMDPLSMRDTITPISKDRKLPIEISTDGMEVDNIKYEIRSLNGEKLVANGELTDYVEEGNKISAEITVQNLLEEELEYNLIFYISSGKQSIYYYTRLMQTETANTKKCLAFAKEFHGYTFDRELADAKIPNYMEAATGDATTLNYVDLTCTLKQIRWADFEGEVVGQPKITFHEINDSYNVICMNYVMTAVNEFSETEYYNVEEYYRLRYANEQMYILNFERTMDEIFRGENSFVTAGTDIQLGIRNPDIEYKESESGDIVAFVQEGELWSFNRGTSEITQVFSFRGIEGIDDRENINEHDIRIAKIDEAGSVDFIVYGYMNRGNHEGEVGMGVYHFDGLAHTVEEEVFIPSNKSFEILKEEVGQLMYENDNELLYLLKDNTLISIDLETLQVNKVVENLKEGCYRSSQSERYFAWVEADKQYQSEVIHFMDLKTGTEKEIKEESSAYLRPIGFMQDDFIYGMAAQDQVYTDAAGNHYFPMYEMKIVDETGKKGKVLKDYVASGTRITNVQISDYTIYISCENGSSDTITNREAEENGLTEIIKTATERKETQYQISLRKEITAKAVKMITPKNILLEEERSIELEQKDETEHFYVYSKGQVILGTESISEAITAANNNMGVVVDNKQQYIWMKARSSYKNNLGSFSPNSADVNEGSVVKAISAMIEYEGDGISVHDMTANGSSSKEVLEATLKNCVILDISGCHTEELLFYISEGSPVFAMTSDESAVLLIGYSKNQITYYNPQNGAVETVDFNTANALFAGGNNRFLTYLER